MKMNCIQAEKQIMEFLRGEMDNRTASGFLEHIRTCPNCREELSINFLVTAGLERLEEGEAFHLNKELSQRLETAERQVRIRRRMQGGLYLYETAAILAVVLLLSLVVL